MSVNNALLAPNSQQEHFLFFSLVLSVQHCVLDPSLRVSSSTTVHTQLCRASAAAARKSLHRNFRWLVGKERRRSVRGSTMNAGPSQMQGRPGMGRGENVVCHCCMPVCLATTRTTAALVIWFSSRVVCGLRWQPQRRGAGDAVSTEPGGVSSAAVDTS
jgi:hypothetical protein